MNKYYALVPVVLLAAFFVFERDFQRKRTKEDGLRAIAAEAAKFEAQQVRLNRERIAAEDARKRSEERERQDRERAEKKSRAYETMIATLKEQTRKQVDEAEILTDELASLRVQLAAERSKKETAERDVFELARRVELQRVDRRNAEIELQRAAAMVAARLADSPWANDRLATATPPTTPSQRPHGIRP